MEAVGEALLSAVLGVLLDRLASNHVLSFIRGRDIEKELKGLKKTLVKVNAVLNDAENKQFKNGLVKEWLDELRDAAYDAEDVLDEFATEALRLKLEAESQTDSNQAWSLIPASLDLSARFFNAQVQSKIKAITLRFDELAQERFELGLEEFASGSSSSNITRETSSVVDESCVYGRDDDREKIMKLLIPEVGPSCTINVFSVISIVGMGGVGKTTLAQILYNDERVEMHFDVKAWVCVSEEFDVKIITKIILESVSPGTYDFSDLNQVQVKLKKALTGKRFLIVLDDVWNKKYSYWDLLRKPFNVGAAGSRIIVTTRNREVASKMDTVYDHYLKHLSEDDCWLVFVHHAFGSKRLNANPTLAAIGKKIVAKCQGLPLAARTLGGLLCSKQEEEEWENVLSSKIWDLPEEENDILPALKLSYHHLPSHLKRCFAYCSIFSKDYEFGESEVVLLWMAEGFLQQPEGKKELEDLGHDYFRELLSRSFFQPSTSNKSLFVMHDLMSDLALWVAGKICFRLEDLLESCEILKQARHSSYIPSVSDGVKRVEAFYECVSLRTLLPLNTTRWCRLTNDSTIELLPKLRRLRVLSFYKTQISELPGSIGDLKHLRYLDLSFTPIESLPDSVCTLYNLQALILEFCMHLKKLPTKMGNLINLRYLDITYANLIEEMPPRVGRLTGLRKLSDFVVGKDVGSGIGELMNLNHLQGRLRISKLENVTDAQQARDANLNDKKGLAVLEMKWCSSQDNRNERVEKEVLDMLCPHEKLEKLTICGYGGVRFPTWMGDPSFSNMVQLRLEDCVKCTSLPPLGQLSSLKDLYIKRIIGVKVVDLEFYGKGSSIPFPSLESLSFEDMQEWKDWFPGEIDKQVEVFPRLQKLSIMSCHKLLGSLPHHLPSLETLTVHRCELLTVTISNLPRLCELEIGNCKEVVQRSKVDLSSLKSMDLWCISKATCLTGGVIKGLTGVEVLSIVDCDELQKEELQNFASLRRLKLMSCKNLEDLQGLHTLSFLTKLSIEACPRLVSFPERSLPSMLETLSIRNCSALKSIAEAIMWHNCTSTSLKRLYIERCDHLMFIGRGPLFPAVKVMQIESCRSLQCLLDGDEIADSSSSSSSSLCCMRAQDSHESYRDLLQSLLINNCPSLMSLLSSSTTGELPATLNHLEISECKSLTSLSPRGELPLKLKHLKIWECLKLESVGEGSQGSMPVELESIQIGRCRNIFSKSFPHGLHRLRTLEIYNCDNFVVSFPEGGLPVTLESLCIVGCPKLESIGERFHNNLSLESMVIQNCGNLKSLPEGLHNLTGLTVFEISKCPSLVHFPDGGFPAINLGKLWISDCKKLESLPDCLHNLTGLQELTIKRCTSIGSFPEEGFPTNIEILRIIDFELCKSLFDWGLHRLTSLRELVIDGGCPDMVSFPALEEGMILPTSLTHLTIEDFPNLKFLSSKGFQNLTSLQTLHIQFCPKLHSFPDKGLPPSLLKLEINFSSLLVQRCKRDQGKEWHKICHIPYIKLEGTLV